MVTKIQIARALGISRTSVSHALNHNLNVRIAASTRRRILEVAREMGYAPPPARPSPVQANIIAFVVCSERGKPFRNPWHFQVLTELQHFASQHDSCVVFLLGDESPDSIQQMLRSIDVAQPRGVVLDGAVPETLALQLKERGMPFIIAGHTPLAVDPRWAGQITNVTADLTSCVDQLMHWVHDRGARSIALISHPLDYLGDRLVLQAYQAAVRFLNLPYDPALIQVCADSSSASRILSHCQQLGISYDGLLFSSTALAAVVIPQAIASAQARGRPQPPMAAVGSPDIEGENLNAIAVCGLDCRRFTQAMYDLLFEQIATPSKRGRTVEVPVVFRSPISRSPVPTATVPPGVLRAAGRSGTASQQTGV